MDIRENSRGAEDDGKTAKKVDKKISLNRDSGHTINEVVTNNSVSKKSQRANSAMEVADAAK